MGGMPAQPPAPAEKNAYRYEDGNLVESKEIQDGKIITKQISSADEQANKKRREADIVTVEGMMKDFLPNLNTINPDLQKQLDAQAESMSSGAKEDLQKSYDNVMKTLTDAAGSRFGSTKNAFYENERDSINKTLAEQQSKVSEDIQARENDLRQQELGGRQNYYNNLQSWASNLRQGVNDFRDEAAQGYNSNMQASQMSNNFDTSVYSNQISAYNAQVAAQAQKTAGLFGMFSDARLKENIAPSHSALDKLSQIRAYDYNLIGDNDRTMGLMAQELEKVYPDLVKPSVGGYKTVNYVGLIPALVDAINELRVSKGV